MRSELVRFGRARLESPYFEWVKFGQVRHEHARSVPRQYKQYVFQSCYLLGEEAKKSPRPY